MHSTRAEVFGKCILYHKIETLLLLNFLQKEFSFYAPFSDFEIYVAKFSARNHFNVMSTHLALFYA